MYARKTERYHLFHTCINQIYWCNLYSGQYCTRLTGFHHTIASHSLFPLPQQTGSSDLVEFALAHTRLVIYLDTLTPYLQIRCDRHSSKVYIQHSLIDIVCCVKLQIVIGFCSQHISAYLHHCSLGIHVECHFMNSTHFCISL